LQRPLEALLRYYPKKEEVAEVTVPQRRIYAANSARRSIARSGASSRKLYVTELDAILYEPNEGRCSQHERMDPRLERPPAPRFRRGNRVLMKDEECATVFAENPSVFDPSIEEKIELLHLMESRRNRRGHVRLSIPGVGPRLLRTRRAGRDNRHKPDEGDQAQCSARHAMK